MSNQTNQLKMNFKNANLYINNNDNISDEDIANQPPTTSNRDKIKTMTEKQKIINFTIITIHRMLDKNYKCED